ncbi:MAG: hypothetical protein LQ342_000616 [Letrouitia transgressa]|nr:MAG: hypothetical protein LQ342_000616 [Letrouitia transgressa]
MEQFLKEKLPRAFKEKNNTSGWRDLTAAEISKIKLQSIGRYAQRSKAKDESKRETYIRTAYDLWKRQLGEEGVDVLSKEDQLTICELLARKGTEQELDPSQGTDDDEDVDEELAYQHDGDFLYEEPDDEDFRTFSPCNEQEEDAIKEALEHSVNEYARLTGDRPLTMDKRLSYATQYNQIVHALRDFFWGCGLGYPPRLVRLQRWAGGIENWRSVGFEFELNGGVETELAES